MRLHESLSNLGIAGQPLANHQRLALPLRAGSKAILAMLANLGTSGSSARVAAPGGDFGSLGRLTGPGTGVSHALVASPHDTFRKERPLCSRSLV
jgi:hypothetical protein